MADIVHQGKGLDQINVQSQLSGNGASDLRNFDSVSQPIAKVVGVAASEDLSFGFETTKGPGVNDAITITLKVVSIRMLRLGITASAGLLHPHGVVGEHGESVAEAA